LKTTKTLLILEPNVLHCGPDFELELWDYGPDFELELWD